MFSNNPLEKTDKILEEPITSDPWEFSLIDRLTPIKLETHQETNRKNPFSNAFFQLRQEMSKEKMKPLLENCFEAGMKDTMRLIMYIRNRTGDIKEKDIGRNAFMTLREINPQFVALYYKEYVRDAGCLNDLLHFAAEADKQEGIKDHLELKFIACTAIQSYMKNVTTDKGQQLLQTLSNKRKGRHYRLLQCFTGLENNSDKNNIPPYFIYKWLPKFGVTKKKNGNNRKKKWEREYKFATRLSKLMFMHSKVSKKDNPEREALYRELCFFLRELSENVPVEVAMCNQDWENIDPTKATLGAQKKYKNCFARRIPEKFKKEVHILKEVLTSSVEEESDNIEDSIRAMLRKTFPLT